MLQWDLMIIDDEIIVILFIFFMATVAWRYFFRWDSGYGAHLKRDKGVELVPPVPRPGNEVIAVLSSTSWNLAVRCTWLVQGLLAAGYRVFLYTDKASFIKNLNQNIVHDFILYNSFSSMKKIMQMIESTGDPSIGRVILANFGGERGLKNIRSVMLGSSGQVMQHASCIYLISESKQLAIPELEQGLFKDAVLVQHSRGQLRDAELLSIAALLRWLA